MDYRDFGKAYAGDIIRSPYLPRPWQREVHMDPHRFKVAVIHRRGGKTICANNEVLDQSLTLVRDNVMMAPPRYCFVAPTNDAAKDLGFRNMQTFLGDWPYETKETAPASITYPSQAMPGVYVTVDFIGAHRLDMYRGRYLDGVVVDEFSEIPGRAWKGVIYPMLSDYKGWGMVIGTPKGRNQFYHLYKSAIDSDEWGVHYYPAEDTGIIDQDELDRQLELMGPELFGQEYRLDWLSAMWGAYYASLLYKAEAEGRIRDVPHDPGYPVHTAWDLGVDGAMVTWFWQQVGSQVLFIDHYETEGVGLDQYIDEHILDRTDEAGRRYRYGRHCFPHDLHHKELWGGKDRYELTVQKLRGQGTVEVVPRRSVDDGIEVSRRLIPRCYFDKQKCSDGIDMLSLYRSKYDEKNSTGTGPLKDSSAHTADAFRMAALGIQPVGSSFASRGDGPMSTGGLSMDAIMRQHGMACPYYTGTNRSEDPLDREEMLYA